MKKLVLLSVFAGIACISAQATEVKSTSNQVKISRVVQLITLVNNYDLKVTIAVEDLGGSTDVSPTQNAYFTLYSKGDSYSTDATFNLGSVYSVESAKRISGGIYEIILMVGGSTDFGIPTKKTLRINAIKAITELKSVTCEEFDCEASSNFKSSIFVN